MGLKHTPPPKTGERPEASGGVVTRSTRSHSISESLVGASDADRFASAAAGERANVGPSEGLEPAVVPRAASTNSLGDFAGFHEDDVMSRPKALLDRHLLDYGLRAETSRREPLEAPDALFQPLAPAPDRDRRSSMRSGWSGCSGSSSRSLAAKEKMAKLRAADEFRSAVDEVQRRKLAVEAERLAAEQEERRLRDKCEMRELELLVDMYDRVDDGCRQSPQANEVAECEPVVGGVRFTGTIPKTSRPHAINALPCSDVVSAVAQPLHGPEQILRNELRRPSVPYEAVAEFSHERSSAFRPNIGPVVSQPELISHHELRTTSGVASNAVRNECAPPVTKCFQGGNPRVTFPVSSRLPSSVPRLDAPQIATEDTLVPARVDSSSIALAHLLADFQRENRLPKREPCIFSGKNIEDYVPFIGEFSSMIESSCSNKALLYSYLVSYTTGEAAEIVRSCFSDDRELAYEDARAALDEHYGDAYLLAHQFLTRLKEWPNLRRDNVEDLRKFSVFLIRVGNMCRRSHHFGVLNSGHELRAIVDKLPSFMASRWSRRALKLREQGQRILFEDLVEFVKRETAAAAQPYFGSCGSRTNPAIGSSTSGKRVLATAVDDSTVSDNGPSHSPVRVQNTKFENANRRFRGGISKNVTGTNAEPLAARRLESQKLRGGTSGDNSCWGCGKSGHRLDSCREFVSFEGKERDKYLEDRKLCLYCQGKHLMADCRSFSTLGSEERRSFIHGHDLCFSCKRIGHRSADCKEKPKTKQDDVTPAYTSHVVRTEGKMSPTVVVDVQSQDGSWVRTRAALDSHSSVSFIENRLAKALKLPGRRCEFRLTTFSNIAELRQSSAIVNLKLRSLAGEPHQVSLVYRTDNWPFRAQDVPASELISSNQVLSRLIPDASEYPVGILIGMDEPRLVKVLESRDASGDGTLYASRFELGWAACGNVDASADSEARCHRVSLDEQIRLEFARAFEDDFPLDRGESVEDSLWRQRVDQSLRHRDDGKLEIGLPFRQEEEQVSFPYNHGQALGALSSLARRFERDQKLAADYRAFMSDLIDSGVVEEVGEGEQGGQTGKVFFLCHHAIYHRNKGKIRVVFDCSRKCGSVSLNDKLLQGPNLLNSLVGVLMRFRAAPVAVVGDIKKMFLQLRVPKRHRDFMRILWWPEGDSSQSPKQYRLTAHTFGAVSSPSLANYAVKWALEQRASQISGVAARAVDRSLYVDDLMCCFRNSEEAVDTLNEVRAVLSFAGFDLVELASNSREVLSCLDPASMTADLREVDLAEDDLPAGRVLGLYWNVQEDCFSFHVDVPDRKWTKRSMLSVIGGLFDPLGLLLPLVVAGRALFQQACRLSDGWDRELPPEVAVPWSVWTGTLPDLRQCRFPRHIGLVVEPEVSLELHIFCDGSETAYAAVAYVRRVVAGSVDGVHLLQARARQTPVGRGPLRTIPRIELNAARLAVELGITLKTESDVQWSRELFWTDSSIVLAYLRNVSARYQRFVANRVAFVQSYTDINSWRFVPGKLNAADIASRGSIDVAELLSSTWVNGPSFLQRSELPQFEEVVPDPACLETCKVAVVERPASVASFWDRLFANVSCWKRMRHRVAVLVGFMSWLRSGRQRRVALTDDVWRAATRAIWRGVQANMFAAQRKLVRKGLPLHRGDVLEKLHPFLDADDLLKTSGRLGGLSDGGRPVALVILPRRSRVVEAYVRFVHQRVGHFGSSYLRAAVSENLHVMGLSSLVKTVVWHCVICRKAQGRPSYPKMADLPVARAEPVARPFVHCGIDFFGPFYVKERRSALKRYGVVFSCLTTRAVHFEVACNLTTDSFLSCFRRFQARRGKPMQVFCDNGTNFVGACRELSEGLSELSGKEFSEQMAREEVRWIFRPPHASHWGGSWEREIRTARKVLWSLFSERPGRLTDESLNTLMCEVEAIMNRRPLTPVQAFSPDMGPLTPQHLLSPGFHEACPPCAARSNEQFYVKRWRAVQYYADEFWMRWRREYLPLLRERSKWNRDTTNPSVGDLVLLVEVGLPRFRWPIGVVSKVYESQDGIVRKVGVRVAPPRDEFGMASSGRIAELLRPVSKLIPVARISDE